MKNPRSFAIGGNETLESAVRGFARLHPGLILHEKQRVVYRRTEKQNDRVTILSGGGSGHEPAHVGYVGSSMLDAAVCGSVFASPNAKQIETGLNLIKSSKGTLVIFKNYTGDKLNFTLAAERFRFATNSQVRLVVVGDDVSIGRVKSARVGRRGLAGVILVEKIAGGAAAAGWSLDEVAEISQYVVENMGTIGVALDGCDVPGIDHQPRLAINEVELGIGIHNEPGSRRISPRPALDTLLAEMLTTILSETDEERQYLKYPPRPNYSDVVVLINNLGGLSTLEIAAITEEVCQQLTKVYGIEVSRVYAGTFLSALNGPGFSITILNLPTSERLSSSVLEFLDKETDAFGWAQNIRTEKWENRMPLTLQDPTTPPRSPEVEKSSVDQLLHLSCDPEFLQSIINSVHASLVAAEPEITRLDLIMGDGDCGTTLMAGAAGVADAVLNNVIDTSNLSHGLMAIADVISQCMGGTSGALYAVFFTGFASSICQFSGKKDRADFSCIVTALHSALHSLEQVTAARQGDRTMMDALIPFVETLVSKKDESPLVAMECALRAAQDGCEHTRNVESKFGRSTYVSAEDSKGGTQGIADPGACGIVAIINGVREALKTTGFT